jgi:hypothetical protein
VQLCRQRKGGREYKRLQQVVLAARNLGQLALAATSKVLAPSLLLLLLIFILTPLTAAVQLSIWG